MQQLQDGGVQERQSGDPRLEELYSSAYTLSDMEIFVFPELLYSLVLANIISERLWEWKDDPWFAGITRKSPKQRLQRIKQYIMDHYSFNLDLDTWGLTTKEQELRRFAPFVDIEQLKSSNALFGYEGDKYYFSLDIRRHFGLDKYNSEQIPYWKTETLEAMDAFVHKPEWTEGGGECVSLSTLYAAACYVVAEIPLEDIYLLATPLHSQNFVDIDDGILTNNRRIVTKTMFFNGTELSAKARRALENEKITIVARCGQYAHFLYDRATLPRDLFEQFRTKLSGFLKTDFNAETFGNFIRGNQEYARCFCYRRIVGSREYYIEAEKALRYEASSKLKVSDKSRKKLLNQIDLDEFYPDKLPGRLVVNDLESYIRENRLDLDRPESIEALRSQFCTDCNRTCDIVRALRDFLHVVPKLPELEEKQYIPSDEVTFAPGTPREEIIARLQQLRPAVLAADLAFHAYREPGDQLAPYFKAAIERNPVAVVESRDLSISDLVETLQQMADESIYPGNRLAQPDEVWNYSRGDGFEKGVLLYDVLVNRYPGCPVVFEHRDGSVTVSKEDKVYTFRTARSLPAWRSVHGAG